MVALVSCKTTDQAPRLPKFDLKQPLIEVQVCENGVCQKISVCKLWRLNKNGEWVLVENQNISECNGSFGVSNKDLVGLMDYSRRLETWIRKNCGTNSNR